MRKILLSAFACNPHKGSESLNGWNWSLGLADAGFEVHTLTRAVSMPDIQTEGGRKNLYFHFIRLPLGLERLYSFSQPTMYLYYILWQWFAYRKGKALHRQLEFLCAHHVSWGSIQQGSFLYKLKTPFIFGPAGGGQKAPAQFKQYFGDSWKSEVRRERAASLLVKYNPAFKGMVRHSSTIWVSNPDTEKLVKDNGGKNIHRTLDAALPIVFFPKNFTPKKQTEGKLSLLWVGRLMPRKAILLVLEVMAKLKTFPTITLTVVGDGDQRRIFQKYVAEKGLRETVIWKGMVPFEEVKSIYSTHDVFLFSSLRDSCPAQLIEAMAYGLPVVTLMLHGQAIIVNDETGFRCAVESPEKTVENLANAVLTLFREPVKLAKMSSAAHAFAVNQTWPQKINYIIEQCYPPQ